MPARRLLLATALLLLLLLSGLGAVLIWAATAPGFLNTERITTDPAKVAAIATSDLGIGSLPPGVTGIGAREDGRGPV